MKRIEDNNESSKGPANADAFSALEIAMECLRFAAGCHSARMINASECSPWKSEEKADDTPVITEWNVCQESNI
ncbi:hypothetical protein TNCV_4935871 [Trichonephila clavipes]|nr:hypothetical protein TNCV_4935871 [Trichonephila clavipes]